MDAALPAKTRPSGVFTSPLSRLHLAGFNARMIDLVESIACRGRTVR